MQILYLILLGSLVFQALVFLLLNMPSPPGVKGRIARFFATDNKVQIFLLAHLGFCLLAILLFVDSYRIENKYREERELLLLNKSLGTELRKSELAYKLLLVQRNKYISFMTVFVSLALNLYILLSRYLYHKRDKLELRRATDYAKTIGKQIHTNQARKIREKD